jgi:hypothetical protein
MTTSDLRREERGIECRGGAYSQLFIGNTSPKRNFVISGDVLNAAPLGGSASEPSSRDAQSANPLQRQRARPVTPPERARLSNWVQKRAEKELVCTRTFIVVQLKGLSQEGDRFWACIFRDSGTCLEVSNFEDCLELRAIRIRVGTSEHFDDETAQGPNVRLTSVRGLFNDLRSHPKDGTLQGGAVLSTGVEHAAGFDAFRYAKIGYFDSALIVDEHVGPFNVAVDDLAAMEIGKTRENLADKVADERFLQRSVLVEKRGHGATRNILEKNIEVILIRTRPKVLHDIRVLQLS